MAFTSAIWMLILGVATQPAEPEPAAGRRIALLDELTSVTEQECVGHDELIARYDAALEAAADEGNAAVVAMLRVGRHRALLLRFVQTDRRQDWDRFPSDVLVLRTSEGVDAPEVREALHALEVEVAGAVGEDLPAPCSVTPAASAARAIPAAAPAPDMALQTVPPPVAAGVQPIPPPAWTRTEKGLVASGSVVGVGGLAAILVGAIGPIAAKNHSRIPATGPSEAQQTFLNETVPRRATIALSVGGVALAAGVGLVVGSMVSRHHRRRSQHRLPSR